MNFAEFRVSLKTLHNTCKCGAHEGQVYIVHNDKNSELHHPIADLHWHHCFIHDHARLTLHKNVVAISQECSSYFTKILNSF